MEFDPPRDPSVIHPTAPARIRLLYDKEIYGTVGVVDVSSDEDIGAPGTEPVLSKRWRAGVLQPQAGVEVDMPLPEPLDVQDALLLPTFWALWSAYAVESDMFGHPGVLPDVPGWASSLFSDPHFHWTTARVEALSASLLVDLKGTEDVSDGVGETLQSPEAVSNPSSSSRPSRAESLPTTKWGRCMYLGFVSIFFELWVDWFPSPQLNFCLLIVGRDPEASYVQCEGNASNYGSTRTVLGMC